MSTATPAAFTATADPSARPTGRRSWWGTALLLLVGFVLGAAAVAAAGAWYFAQGTPDFYTRAVEATPPAERRAQAEAFTERTVELAREIEYSDDWEQTFTQAQVNGWLAEELPERFGDRIPNAVSDPRVDLTRPGLVRLGFRLHQKRFDGVVSLAVRPTVVGPNQVALRVEGLMAGLFPLDVATFAPQVSKYLDEYNVAHEWDLKPAADATTGRVGPPVLTVTLTRRAAGRAVLEDVQIEDNAVRVAGSRTPAVRLTRR